MAEVITSPSNPKIKRLLALQQKSSARREAGLFVVEGRRELQHCIDAGFAVDSVFVCPALLSSAPEAGAKVFEVSEEVYAKIAMREGTEGVVAEVRMPERRLEDLALPENPLVMVLERVEKPGNLGAVLRSADAAGADAVLVCDPLTDLWNPNLIRASVGAVFTVPCVACSSQEAIAWLKARGIRILTAQLQDSSLYYDCDMTVGTALVMGTEATGLTGQWRQAADAHIRIPMLGALDSLNVSVSAAILLFEAVRQRRNG
jgi:TrmH family RNA methyltransferase